MSQQSLQNQGTIELQAQVAADRMFEAAKRAKRAGDMAIANLTEEFASGLGNKKIPGDVMLQLSTNDFDDPELSIPENVDTTGLSPQKAGNALGNAYLMNQNVQSVIANFAGNREQIRRAIASLRAQLMGYNPTLTDDEIKALVQRASTPPPELPRQAMLSDVDPNIRGALLGMALGRMFQGGGITGAVDEFAAMVNPAIQQVQAQIISDYQNRLAQQQAEVAGAKTELDIGLQQNQAERTAVMMNNQSVNALIRDAEKALADVDEDERKFRMDLETNRQKAEDRLKAQTLRQAAQMFRVTDLTPEGMKARLSSLSTTIRALGPGFGPVADALDKAAVQNDWSNPLLAASIDLQNAKTELTRQQAQRIETLTPVDRSLREAQISNLESLINYRTSVLPNIIDRHRQSIARGVTDELNQGLVALQKDIDSQRQIMINAEAEYNKIMSEGQAAIDRELAELDNKAINDRYRQMFPNGLAKTVEEKRTSLRRGMFVQRYQAQIVNAYNRYRGAAMQLFGEAAINSATVRDRQFNLPMLTRIQVEESTHPFGLIGTKNSMLRETATAREGVRPAMPGGLTPLEGQIGE